MHEMERAIDKVWQLPIGVAEVLQSYGVVIKYFWTENHKIKGKITFITVISVIE